MKQNITYIRNSNYTVIIEKYQRRKKMKSFLLLLTLAVLFTANMYSQQAFKTFLPKEGLPTAIQQAKTEGVNNPKLYFLITTSMRFEQMPPLLQPKVEINTGKSTMWMYQIRDGNNDTISKMVAVLKISVMGFDQFMPVTLPADFDIDILPTEATSLDEMNWLQTDSAFASIRRDPVYISFAKANPLHFVMFSVLGLNIESAPGMEPNTPYWFTLMAKDTAQSSMDEAMTCITNGITNETICLDFTSVSEEQTAFRIYPNPTSDQFYISFDKHTNYPTQISIINLNGVEVMSIKVNEINGNIPLNIGSLPAGEYLIWVNNPKINSLGKIIKQK